MSSKGYLNGVSIEDPGQGVALADVNLLAAAGAKLLGTTDTLLLSSADLGISSVADTVTYQDDTGHDVTVEFFPTVNKIALQSLATYVNAGIDEVKYSEYASSQTILGDDFAQLDAIPPAPTGLDDFGNPAAIEVDIKGFGTISSYSTDGTSTTVGADDDRSASLSVTGGVYNEASPRAIFTISASAGQSLTLDVVDAADTGKAPTGDREGGGNDSLDNAPIYYSLDGGLTWNPYTGTPIIAGSVPVLVAVDITAERDTVYEGEEQFKLVVTSGTRRSAARRAARLRRANHWRAFPSTPPMPCCSTRRGRSRCAPPTTGARPSLSPRVTTSSPSRRSGANPRGSSTRRCS